MHDLGKKVQGRRTGGGSKEIWNFTKEPESSSGDLIRTGAAGVFAGKPIDKRQSSARRGSDSTSGALAV